MKGKAALPPYLATKLLYLSQADVALIGLTMAEIIAALERVFVEKGGGRVEMPPKIGIHTMPDAFIHAMPAFLPSQKAAGMKWVSGYPGNSQCGLPYISGLLIFERSGNRRAGLRHGLHLDHRFGTGTLVGCRRILPMTRALKRHMRWIMNLWPPFLGAGIRVKRLQPDWKAIDVEMKLHFWNANYVGTHFGGSLYSMTDPFYMLMLIENLGRDYMVWDKSASIRFRKPGRGKMHAAFRLSGEEIEAIRQALETQEKIEPTFVVEVKDETGDVIAEVQKVLYVRRKGSTEKLS